MELLVLLCVLSKHMQMKKNKKRICWERYCLLDFFFVRALFSAQVINCCVIVRRQQATDRKDEGLKNKFEFCSQECNRMLRGI